MGSAPPRPARLCLLFAGSTGAVSTFSPGCACGGGNGGEGAAIPRTHPGHGRGSVRENRSRRSREPPPRLASCLCRVAPQLSAPSGAEAGASAGPDELSVKRTGHCSPALRSQPPPPHPRCHCPASRCIKDLNRSHRPALLILPPLPPFGLGAPLHAGCFRLDRASLPDRVSVRVQAPIIRKGPSSESGLPLLPVIAFHHLSPPPHHTHTHLCEWPVWRELNNPGFIFLPALSPHP